MKKMTFALACASAFAIFAEDAAPAKAPLADFESITAGTLLSAATAEANGPFWAFAEGDSSTVKAYETASDRTGANYLELSTEGNTLWRSINAVQTAGQPGAAETIPETGFYIDTMVQFTPTEDGGEPELDATSDKLAIWLNVTAGENGAPSTTNLCVRAGFIDDNGTATSCKPKTYILTGAGDINPATWYRLKVKSIADSTKCMAKNPNAYDTGYLGFQIYLNNQLLTATEDTIGSGYVDLALDAGEYGWLNETDDAAIVALMRSKTLFPCLLGAETSATLQAVGFKGSGALDNLQFTTEDPGGEAPAPVVKVGLSISAENATVTGITAGMVEVGSSLTFTVTAAEGYNLTGVMINGKTVTANTEGNYTYTVKTDDTAVAVVVTTEAIPSIDWDNPKAESGTAAAMFGIEGALATADGQKLAAWAQNVGKVSFDKASEIKTDAFLLNCANEDDAINTAKKDFVIPAITVGADGKVTVTPPDGSKYNGVITIKGATAVDGDYDLAADAAGAKFFKAFLSLPAAE